jgi:hypothetical protein
MTLPPFLAGQAAHRAGQPIEANHYPTAERVSGDDYPGDFHNWRDGWLFAEGLGAHTKKSERTEKRVDATPRRL